MKMMMMVRLPHEAFNNAVRDGSAGATIGVCLVQFQGR